MTEPTDAPTEAPTEAVVTPPTHDIVKGTVAANNLNVRSNPSTDSTVLSQLPVDLDIDILEQRTVGDTNWGRIGEMTLPNGTKILMWGSAPTPEQYAICKAEAPDIAIIQRAGISRAEKRADFAAAIGAKVVIPHHHDFHGVDDPAVIEAFRDEYLARVPDGTFIIPRHGEWIEL